MRELNEDVPLTMTMFCEEYHSHKEHPWSEVRTVHCPGYKPEEAEEPDR